MNNVLSKFLSWGISAKLVTIFVIFGAVPMTAVGLIAFGAAALPKNIGEQEDCCQYAYKLFRGSYRVDRARCQFGDG